MNSKSAINVTKQTGVVDAAVRRARIALLPLPYLPLPYPGSDRRVMP